MMHTTMATKKVTSKAWKMGQMGTIIATATMRPMITVAIMTHAIERAMKMDMRTDIAKALPLSLNSQT